MPKGLKASMDGVREQLLRQIIVAENLKSAVGKLKIAIHPNAGPSLHPKHAYRITELAFMGVWAAWEDFLETSIVRYLAGADAACGFKPTLRLGPCKSIPHAFEVVSGKPGYDPEKNVMSWTNPNAVIKLAANVFFDGGAPYKLPLSREADRLKQAFRIRNRIAHASEKCKADFRKAANAIRQLPAGSRLGRGFRAGQLLDDRAGPFFGPDISSLNITVFDAYMRIFKQLAEDIVPSH